MPKAKYVNVQVHAKDHAKLLRLKAKTGVPITKLLARIVKLYSELSPDDAGISPVELETKYQETINPIS